MTDFTPPPAYQPEQPPRPVQDNSASLGKRLAAFLLDSFLMLLVFSIVIQFLGIIEIDPNSKGDIASIQAEMLARLENMSGSQRLTLVLMPYFIFFALHSYLLSRYGQTIGKRLLGIAIVTQDGRTPVFSQLIVQRYCSQWLAGFIPVLGSLLRLVDVLFIFREDRRCLHDHLAKTRVIDLRIAAAKPGVQTAPGDTLIV